MKRLYYRYKPDENSMIHYLANVTVLEGLARLLVVFITSTNVESCASSKPRIDLLLPILCPFPILLSLLVLFDPLLFLNFPR